MKSQVSSRSVSVPLTLSDLERRDTRVEFFQRLSVRSTRRFDRQYPNSEQSQMWGSGVSLEGHARSLCHEAGPQLSKWHDTATKFAW